jgi:hypothetical protein
MNFRDLFRFFAKLKPLEKGGLLLAAFVIAGGVVAIGIYHVDEQFPEIAKGLAIFAAVFAGLLKFWSDARTEQGRRAQVASIEKRVVEHPEKPQLA